MSTFSAAERAYEHALMAGPPEPVAGDMPVTFSAAIRNDELDTVIARLGDDVSYTGPADREGWRDIAGTILVEDVGSTDAAEDVVIGVARDHLGGVLDLDTLSVTAEPSELAEPDWDAIAKDHRLEAVGLL